MTSIRALLENLKSGKENARKIDKILFDTEKSSSKSKELSYLKKMSEKFGFAIEKADGETIDSLTTGNSHGGIIAICK